MKLSCAPDLRNLFQSISLHLPEVVMKRIAVILFSVFYLALSTGFSITVHVCHGKMKSVQLVSGDCSSNCCDTNTSHCSADCCRNEQLLLKLNEAQIPGEITRIQADHLTLNSFYLPFSYKTKEPEIYTPVFSGPDIIPSHSPPRWKLFCAPIFYG